METGKNKTNYVVLAAAAFITWGCMTFRYVGNGFSLAAICFGLLAIFLTIKEHYRPRFQLPSDLRNAMIALYGGLCIVGILQGDIIENLLLGSISVFQLFFITSPMWMILYVGRRMDIRKIVSIIIFANMYAFSIYGLGLYFYQDQQRFTSFYGSPPEVGMLLDILIPFSAAIGAYYWADRRWRIATVLLIPLEFLALILTETRGSYLALAAALIIGMFIWLHKNKHSISKTIKHGIYGAMLLAACGAVGGTLYVGSSSAQRMIGGERLLMWESSYYMWKDHPLLGIGLSKWGDTYNDPQSKYFNEKSKERTQTMPHNVYIYFLATGGLAAFASVAGYIFFMFRYLMRLLREQGHNPIIWGMLLMVIAFLAHGMVDASLISRHIGRIYYLLLGLGVLFANALKEDNK